jgi:hypothetical protein
MSECKSCRKAITSGLKYCEACHMSAISHERDELARNVAELEAERDAIHDWLDEWMETSGNDFPRRDNTPLMGRVNILAHMCHAEIGYRKTAVRICLEQQAKCKAAEKKYGDLVDSMAALKAGDKIGPRAVAASAPDAPDVVKVDIGPESTSEGAKNKEG